MTTGIYAIKGPNGRTYIGSAVHIGRRWTKHRQDLKRGLHHCAPLQRAFVKYGAEAFEFVVVAETSADRLLQCEQRALDAIPKAKRYNTCAVAGSRLGDKATAEALANMRRAKANVSAETRARISATHKASGIRPTREAALKGVAARLRKGVSAATRQKMAAANAGRVHSEAERKKRSASKTHALTRANTSGVVGVHRHASGKWLARVKVGATRQYLGLFDTLDAAAAAVAEKRQ